MVTDNVLFFAMKIHLDLDFRYFVVIKFYKLLHGSSDLYCFLIDKNEKKKKKVNLKHKSALTEYARKNLYKIVETQKDRVFL